MNCTLNVIEIMFSDCISEIVDGDDPNIMDYVKRAEVDINEVWRALSNDLK